MDTILDLTKKLIAIPSTTDNQKALHEALDLATEKLKGFTVENFEKNGKPSILVYAASKRPKNFKVILNGHLDVVPGSPKQYTPTEKNGKLYGRGAYDMKAGAGALLHVFKETAQNVKYPLGLQLVTDEEIGGHNGTKYQIDQGVKADFVITGENSDFNIRNEAKGIVWVKVITSGKTSHGAYPWQGHNAIWDMHAYLNQVQKFFPIPKKAVWQTTINLARIETTNATYNKVPSDCIAFFDIRYIPQDKTRVINKLKQMLPKGAQLEIVVNEPTAYTNPNHPYIKDLQASAKKITGVKPKLLQANGASDVRFYKNGIEFGLKGSGNHADEEWVDIQSLEDYYNILKEFLLSL